MYLKTLVFLILISFSLNSYANSLINSLFTKVHEYLDLDQKEKALFLLRNKSIELVGVDKELSHFAQGILSVDNGQYKEGLIQLNQIKDLDELDDYINYYKSLAQFHLKNYKEADKTISKIKKTKSKTQKDLNNKISFLKGKLDLQFGRGLDAYKNLTPLLKSWRGTYQKQEVLTALLDSAIKDKLFSKGRYCPWFYELYEDYPNSNISSMWGLTQESLVYEKKQIDCDISIYNKKARIKKLYLEGFNPIIEAALKNYEGKELVYLNAYYQYLVGDMAKALKTMKAVEDKLNFSEKTFLARLYYYGGQPQKSINIYKSLFELTKSYYKKAWLNIVIAEQYLEIQDFKNAINYFETAKNDFSRSKRSVEGEWGVAWAKYLNENYQEAYQDFITIIENARKDPRKYKSIDLDKSFYWSARALQKSGQNHLAVMIYKELAEDPSISYYALLSSLRMSELAERSNILLTQKDFLNIPWAKEVKNLAEKKSKFIDSLKLAARMPSSFLIGVHPNGFKGVDLNENYPKTPLETTNQEKSEHKDVFNRYTYLTRVGFLDDASHELSLVKNQAKTKPLKNLLLDYFLSVDDYSNFSRLATLSFYSERQSEDKDLAYSYWSKAYPKAYEEYVNETSRLFNVSKNLVWGVMRAESFFDPKIVSPVGARGLLQIMPYTGIKLQALLSGHNPLEIKPSVNEQMDLSSSLSQPRVNIRYGSFYLKRLLKQFDGHLPFAITSYNGGPHRVKLWSSKFGNREQDEFTEMIPFDETRKYLKKVSRNMFIYDLLYSDEDLDMNFLVKKIPFKLEGEPPTAEYWGML